MAIFEGLKCLTFVAGEDLSAKQYHFVKLNDSGKVVACSSNGENAQGILMNEPTSGTAATVAMIESGGKCKLVASGSISVNNFICTSSTGRAAVADTDTEYVLGKALSASTGNGQVITVLFDKLTNTQT